MKWLMNVSNIVDNEAQGKGKLIRGVGECSGNLLIVGGALIVSGVGQHANESVHSLYEVSRGSLKGVVRGTSTLVVVGNVNKVPV